MMAFQNPATIQGSVIANKTISTRSIALKPAGRQCQRSKRDQCGHGDRKQRSKQRAPTGDGISGSLDLFGLKYGTL